MSEDLVSIKRNGKNFKIQPLEHFEKIQKEVLAWILEKDLYKEWIVDNSRFHKSGTCDMPVSVLDSLPYTKKAIEELGEPTRLTFWITRGEDTLPCHVDGGFEHFWVPRSRLLIPVVNYTDTTTIFYSKNVKLENFQDTGGVSYLRPIDPTQLKETERVEVDQPIWIRIDNPHTVINPNKHIRIAFTVVYDHAVQIKYMPS
jgi:hypothetical protein